MSTQISERKAKQKRINDLLHRHNLTLIWQNILNRWILVVVDAYNREVWRRRGMNLKAYRDELIEFLENYARREQYKQHPESRPGGDT